MISKTTPEKRTIQQVVDSKLCTGCGTCAGVCPSLAIRIVKNGDQGIYLPLIEDKKCSRCGTCYQVCPGHFVDFNQLCMNSKIEGSKNLVIGSHITCYLGYSAEAKIRYDRTSGGMVTQLLIFALEEGMIDGALVVRTNANNPLEPEAFIAKTRQDLISSSTSKYCPVSINVALKEIINKDGKFAVVGLPCHIHGIRKLEALNKELKEKICLHLGLFCCHTINFTGTDIILERYGLEKKDVRRFDYRGNGWPGKLSIFVSGEDVPRVQCNDFQREFWNLLFGPYFLTPLRCMSCPDQTNELADISLGDAWLKEITGIDKQGTSMLVSRTKIGEDLLKKTKSNGSIILNVISCKKVVEAQRPALFFKKVSLGTRMSIMKFTGSKIPKYVAIRQQSNILLYPLCTFQLLDTAISQKKIGRYLLRYSPHILLRGWGAVFYYLEVFSNRFLGRSGI